MNVRVQNRGHLAAKWAVLCAIATFAFLAAIISFLVAFHRDLKLLAFRLRCSAPSGELHVALLSSAAATPTTVHLEERLREELGPLYHLEPPPLAGTPSATIAVAAAVPRDSSFVAVVLLDGASLANELFIAQMKSLMLSSTAWRVFVALESFRKMRRTPDLPPDGNTLLDQLKGDAKYRDLISWGQLAWRVRQVRLCLELRRWYLAKLSSRN